MNRIKLIAVLITLLLVLPLPVQAVEPARYSFASAQGDKELRIPPGREGRGNIYFYNIDGNRITHITLGVSKAPAGWDVSIIPSLSETQVLVGALPVTVVENLYVDPSELLADTPQSTPEGMAVIKVPGRGYALGKLAQVVIRVPDAEPPGKTVAISVAAEASWLSESGAVAVRQARDFDFLITVVSPPTEYSETVIGPVTTHDATDEAVKDRFKETPSESPPATPESDSSVSMLMRWLPAIVAVAIVILGIIFIPLLVRRRK